MGARTARGGEKKHVGSQGMGSDIENRADDLKGVNFVSLAVGEIHVPCATAVLVQGPSDVPV